MKIHLRVRSESTSESKLMLGQSVGQIQGQRQVKVKVKVRVDVLNEFKVKTKFFKILKFVMLQQKSLSLKIGF